MSFLSSRRLALFLACGALSAPVGAQTLSLGTRAQGMGSAFVAVADDASAVVWNPAGLATGALASLVIEGTDVDRPADHPPDARLAGAGRGNGTLIAASLPPLGLSYARLRIDTAMTAPPAGAGVGSRETGQPGLQVRSLVTHNVGVTLLHSLTDYLVVGTTVRLVSGGGAETTAPASGGWDAAFETLEDVETTSSTTGDVDLGVMTSVGRVRVGLLARNLAAPAFDLGAGAEPFRLDRHVRAGVAYGPGWPSTSSLIVAMDADITEVPSPSGDRRDIAAGVEGWLAQRRVGLRGGMRASALGEARPVATGGVSVAIKTGVYVDGHVAAGGDGAERSWGLGGRVVF
jgi:hypothetical protein